MSLTVSSLPLMWGGLLLSHAKSPECRGSSSSVNLQSECFCILPPGGHIDIRSRAHNGTRPRKHALKRHAGKWNPFKIQVKICYYVIFKINVLHIIANLRFNSQPFFVLINITKYTVGEHFQYSIIQHICQPDLFLTLMYLGNNKKKQLNANMSFF